MNTNIVLYSASEPPERNQDGYDIEETSRNRRFAGQRFYQVRVAFTPEEKYINRRYEGTFVVSYFKDEGTFHMQARFSTHFHMQAFQYPLFSYI